MFNNYRTVIRSIKVSWHVRHGPFRAFAVSPRGRRSDSPLDVATAVLELRQLQGEMPVVLPVAGMNGILQDGYDSGIENLLRFSNIVGGIRDLMGQPVELNCESERRCLEL